jgi:hypothetical protein
VTVQEFGVSASFRRKIARERAGTGMHPKKTDMESFRLSKYNPRLGRRGSRIRQKESIMELRGARKLSVFSRPMLVVIPLAILLLISFGWNLSHYRMEQQNRARKDAAVRASKAAVALAREHAERQELRRRARAAESDKRVEQLYQEINYFTKVAERLVPSEQEVQTTPAELDRHDETAD